MIAAPRIVVAGLLAALLLTACTDDPEPRFAEPSPSPSASESTSPAVDEREPWDRKSKAGAVAFAKHWIDVFNAAQASGETSELDSISATSCKSCSGYIGQLDHLYGGGGHLETDGWKVLQVGSPPGGAGAHIEIPMRIDRTAQKVVSGNGKVQRFGGGGVKTFAAELRWADSQWVMHTLDII